VPPPAPDTAPTAYDTTKTTRSAFVKTPIISSDTPLGEQQAAEIEPPQLFTRLLSFSIPGGDVLFTRFCISPSSTGRSILAYANRYSRIFFWDLERLIRYYDWTASSPHELSLPEVENPDQEGATTKEGKPLRDDRPPFLSPFQRRPRPPKGTGQSQDRSAADKPRKRGRPRLHRSPSPTNSSIDFSREASEAANKAPTTNINPTDTTSDPTTITWKDYDPITKKKKVDWKETNRLWEAQYEMRDAFKGIEAQKEIVLKGLNLTGRKLAWSVDGQWCVCVGSQGYIALLQNKVKGRTAEESGENGNGDGEGVEGENAEHQEIAEGIEEDEEDL
jgi:polycomb protein EED